jgi:hypothetical protein
LDCQSQAANPPRPFQVTTFGPSSESGPRAWLPLPWWAATGAAAIKSARKAVRRENVIRIVAYPLTPLALLFV